MLPKQLKSEKITIVEEINQDQISVKVEDDKSLKAKLTIMKERIKLRENVKNKGNYQSYSRRIHK